MEARIFIDERLIGLPQLRLLLSSLFAIPSLEFDESRTDVYVSLGDVTRGLKLRGGNKGRGELKKRVALADVDERVEHWKKQVLGVGVSSAAELLALAGEPQRPVRQVQVAKQRGGARVGGASMELATLVCVWNKDALPETDSQAQASPKCATFHSICFEGAKADQLSRLLQSTLEALKTKPLDDKTKAENDDDNDDDDDVKKEIFIGGYPAFIESILN